MNNHYRVIMNTDIFKLRPARQEEFYRIIDCFEGVEVERFEAEDGSGDSIQLKHNGEGYILNTGDFSKENEEIFEYLNAKAVLDLPGFIQYCMLDKQAVVMRDIYHSQAEVIEGTSYEITKNRIDKISLHQ